MRWILLWILSALPLAADGGRPGQFDYYVLSLSWSPNWCALEGARRFNPQCDAGRGHGWVLHGLWPQYHRGYPSYCQAATRPPSRAETAEMADIMGSPGSAWHQWKKHGTCSGLTSQDYFALAREAYGRVTRPPLLRKIDRPMRLPARVIEEAFLEVNPALSPDMVTITCKAGAVQEARICLSRDLTPVPCGQDVVRDCQMTDAEFRPID